MINFIAFIHQTKTISMDNHHSELLSGADLDNTRNLHGEHRAKSIEKSDLVSD